MKQPETGTTVFGRDAVGNLISRQVGASESTHYPLGSTIGRGRKAKTQFLATLYRHL